MRVLIIPEDPTLDRHVSKPVVERIFADLGHPRARVEVLTDPHLSGITQALDENVIAEILEDNRMVDLFLLIIDRDCENYGNSQKAAARKSGHPGKLLTALAREELEVWPLALHRSELSAPWNEVSSDCHPKELFYDPFIEDKGWVSTVGKGRKRAMRALGREWKGLLRVCPEIDELKAEIEQWLQGRVVGS